ncbi:MAG: hypothetical protein ACXWUX_08285 [Allosphingosinicella sp.]
MKFRPMLFIAIATGLYFVSHSLELRGDAAPFAADGVSTERAIYHLAALVLMAGALGFFISAGVSVYRDLRR